MCVRRLVLTVVACWGWLVCAASAGDLTAPLVGDDVVFEERDGLVVIEAEHFFRQDNTDTRAWYLTTKDHTPEVTPDGDPSHIAGASGGAYLEVLPDTRRSHGDRLIKGENFSNEPGKMGILSYKVSFNTPGVYHLWARAYSTTTEDNGLHFGIDGTWPETAQRWQTTIKNRWHWASKQRTAEVHTGVPGILTLSIDKPGLHTLQVSMREDGIALDRILLVNRQDFEPNGVGPEVVVHAGRLPAAYPSVAAPATAAVAQVQAPQPQRARRQTRQPDGDGAVNVTGELKQWHKVTLDLNGPFAYEQDDSPNPFTDLCLKVTFTHESGSPSYVVPGYFAADGHAAETSAEQGTIWRAHFSPSRPGRWSYVVSFTRGTNAALDGGGQAVVPFDGKQGEFTIAATDKSGRDFRAHGQLQYVGRHHLRFAGSGEYFLKAGPDAPETLLAYEDFDGTETKKIPLKSWQPHVQDWREGDPTWQGGKGRGLIGALNYIAGKGCNVFSFLPYNGGGDGENVWPFVAREDKLHYDCSKLDQWQIVMDHAQTLGLYLHFKLQEQENDDNYKGHDDGGRTRVPAALDGGDLGVERKLYVRELVARFGHELALNWNLGEENTQTAGQQRAMSQYIRDTDPYDHHIVVHTFPNWQERVYPRLLGDQSVLTGASLQNGWSQTHERTVRWVKASDEAGKPWVVANDEQGPASLGVPPDPGYAGYNGQASSGDDVGYDLHDIRKHTLWGNLMAGGAGVEYYFGYQLPQNDLICEDFRSRDRSWDYCRYALEFFRNNEIPFWEMTNVDELVGNVEHKNMRYCLAKAPEVYVVYLPDGGTTDIDLAAAGGTFSVAWYHPRMGGKLQEGSLTIVRGGGQVSLGNPPADADQDWVVLLRRSQD